MNSVLRQFDIQGRSALVTGAGSGIGLAYAEALAEAGASVTLAGKTAANVEREAARFRGLGWKARAAEVDVADEEQVRAAFDAHNSEFGRLDIAFANAGVGVGHGFMSPAGGRSGDGQIDTINVADWQRNIDVHLSGAMYTIRHAARLMKAAKRPGSIVVTSSNASNITVPLIATAYMASKAGVAHLVRNVALELAAYKIRVNTISPGSFVTNIGGGHLHNPAVKAAWDKIVPLGEMGNTEQIKALALYLASDASSYMTGADMFIDGGVSLVSGFK
jgi:NAD(P)-dependent dehydrogenase (short-subunit alcohol dehydrogenase family)